jgi:anti-anti-sigma factor
MSAQPEHTRPREFPFPLAAAWCSFSCITESRCCAAGEIIVLRVEGEVDLCTLPTLQAALDESLDRYPAHFFVDLGRVPFCAVRGLNLLTQTGRTAAENATGYAITGVLPQIDRVWTLCWDDDHVPVRYPSTTAAITAIRAADRLSKPGWD